MAKNITHIIDTNPTEAGARTKLKDYPIEVAWYTNSMSSSTIVHSHPYYEIILPVTGQIQYSAGGNIYLLYAGDLILFPADVYHMAKFDVVTTPCERIIVQIDADFWKARCRDLHVEKSLQSKNILLLRSEAISQWNLRVLFERMYKSTQLDGFHRDIAFQSQLAEFMMILDQTIEEKLIAVPNTSSNLATKAMDYIETHFHESQLTVQQVAEYTFVSREHLCRVFKDNTGQTVHDYITALRMQAFREALAEGQPILTACNNCGFADYSSFNRTFRKLYQMTPAEYRNRLNRTDVVE